MKIRGGGFDHQDTYAQENFPKEKDLRKIFIRERRTHSKIIDKEKSR